MYKVRDIADGMIIWKGNAVMGIKGLTLSEIFNDCDCYKLPGNAFDYALAPNNKYTKEQQKEIDAQVKGWNCANEDEKFEQTEKPGELNGDAEFEETESPYGIRYTEDEDVPLTDLLNQDIPDDEFVF